MISSGTGGIRPVHGELACAHGLGTELDREILLFGYSRFINFFSLIKPLDLNETEISDLVEFLKSLTGSNVNQLVSDAYAAPIGDM